jgi:hypothetical protein
MLYKGKYAVSGVTLGNFATSKIQYSNTAIFIHILGSIQLGKHTMRLTR